MKYTELRGRIVEKYGTAGNFAKAIGMTQAMLSLKLNGHSQFSQSQIAEWSRLLDISLKDIGRFFFATKL